MAFLRKILFPFAVLYGWITQVRNYLYDNGILKSHSFDIPIIAVGNLSVGGTGKTPQIEYLIQLLSPNYRIATLSRGYRRNSQGFIIADDCSNAKNIGDEPFQMHSKFPEILVAVDADRCNGITKLLSETYHPEIVLLDDAFQHRKVKAGFYILLTAFDDLYCDDFLLPTGNLREGRSGAKRADIIIVTKCPEMLSDSKQLEIRKKINVTSEQQIYFSSIKYSESIISNSGSISINDVKNQVKVLVAGIAKPQPFFNFLKSDSDIIFEFPDHHDFSENDIAAIVKQAKNKIIVTTEKDFVRLKDRIPNEELYYLPIKCRFLSGSETFDKSIKEYVGKSAGNR